MKRYSFLLVAFAAAFVLQAQAQTIAPDFTKTDSKGNTYNLYEELAKGRTVLLDFFRVGCHACQGTVPSIEKLAKDYSGKLTVWKLDVNNETKEQIAAFKQQYGSTVATFNDCRADFIHYQSLESIAVAATPTFVLIRPDRSIVRGWVGYYDSEIRAEINAIASATGVAEESLPVSAFSLFPSPATNSATAQFSLTIPTDLRIELLDAIGNSINTVFEGRAAANEISTITIPTERLANGMYFLRFLGTGVFFTRALVVAK